VNNMVIDFHTHILPQMDDGSTSLEMTRRLLQMEYSQGTQAVVATPHFYAQKEFPEQFLERRSKRMSQVKELLKTEVFAQKMEIYAGAEVLYYPGISRSEALPRLCIEEKDILLLEMPFREWDKEVYQEVKQIIEIRRLKVILAHVERYAKYQKNKDIWNEIQKLPLILQINADDLCSFTRRGLCRKILKQEIPVVLGSDCHNLQKRPPQMEKGRQVIRNMAEGKETLERMDVFGAQVLGL
jgi:protein-tyrosine phosphatase